MIFTAFLKKRLIIQIGRGAKETFKYQGQIIVPSKMREGLVEGKEFIIVSDSESFVLKANP